MKKIVLAFYIVLVYSFSFSQSTQYVSENIESNTSWTADTIKILESIEVSSDATLVIESGTYVEFQGSFSLTMFGQLLAIGTELDTIIFTINDTTEFHNMETNDGGWNGIRFIESSFSDTSKFEYCKFEYGKSLYENWSGGNTSKPYKGGAVSAYNYSSLTVKYCVFKNNMATYGGAWHDRFTDVNIFYCLFEQNSAEEHAGALFTCQSTIENNIVRNNHSHSGWSKGAVHWDGCSPTIVNNLIYENDIGISGLENFSQLKIVNNTICNNDDYGININFIYNDVLLANNIIYGNGIQIQFHKEGDDAIELYNNNIKGGIDSISGNQYITASYNNFDQLPEFENTMPDPYQLSNISPCINSGTEDTTNLNLPEYDLLGNNRIFQSQIDVGAYEFQGNISIHDYSKNNTLNIYPNPTTGTIIIEAEGVVKVELINIQGETVYISKSNVRNIDMERIVKGVYFVKVFMNNGITVKKIIRE